MIFATARPMALTSQQTEDLRDLIRERRRRLAAELRGDRARSQEEQYGEMVGASPDAGDESVASLIRDLGQAEMTRDLDELRGLEAANDRIAQGRYGACLDCGSDIGYERLRAEPSALRCIDCQRRHEKTFGGTPHPTL